jgi:hypothetical protein
MNTSTDIDLLTESMPRAFEIMSEFLQEAGEKGINPYDVNRLNSMFGIFLSNHKV